MEKRQYDENVEYLMKSILTLHSFDECLRFFEDLCTPSELLEMSRRLQAARMLANNHLYSDIAEKTGLSTATISRVNRCLKFGDDGYHTVIERMAKKK